MSGVCGYWALVPAAGAGRRMGGGIPKQYHALHGRAVLEHSLQRLLEHPMILGLYIALSPGDEWWPSCSFAGNPRVTRVAGGGERCHSVVNAQRRLEQRADPEDWVLVHDAVRPCLRRADIDQLIAQLGRHPVGGILGAPLTDTVKRVDEAGNIVATLPREQLWRAFTPQMFRIRALRSALESALAKNQLVTDEASAMELAGYTPCLVEGHSDNIKVTRPGDLALAGFYLTQQLVEQQ